VRFRNFRITNVCGVATFHQLALEPLAAELRRCGHYASYDPELHPWVLFRPGTMTMRIYRSGKTVITGAASQAALDLQVSTLVPLFRPYAAS
jgi:TATA-box binding protein (TBP) (component of TFIID and TFIIIB)